MLHSLIFFPLFSTLLGLTAGSFMSVVITRLPVSLVSGLPMNLFARSRCPACDHSLGIIELIPLFSWLWLRGRCHHCRTHISALYPFTELACALLFVFISMSYTDAISVVTLWCLSWCLLSLALIDGRTLLLPDLLTLPLLWLGLLTQLLSHGNTNDYVLGAVAGYLALWGIYWGHRAVSGKEGMGYGDFKLSAALGAWVGWQQLSLVWFYAALLGLIYAAFYAITRGKSNHRPLPFGPCLCASGWAVIVLAEYITMPLL